MEKYSAFSLDFYYALDVMRLRNKLAKEMLLNMKNSHKVSFKPKAEIKPPIYTASALYIITHRLKQSVYVYKPSEITTEGLKSMDLGRIHALLSSCNRDIVLLHAEILCRAKGGLKT